MQKIALVTGSSRGIGKSIALTLAKSGFDIIIHCSNQIEKANEVKKEIETLGRKAWVVTADISKDSEVEAMFKEIVKLTDVIDLVVNNAGFDYVKMIEEYTFVEMRYVIDVVLFAKMSITKLSLPLLKKSKYPGIINIASRMGREKTIPTIGAYGPAQAGVMKWTQCCAREFADYKIRVNCIAPGLTETDMSKSIHTKESFEAAAKINPRGRIGKPQDVANLVVFLASEEAEYINGEIIGVNGGSNLS